MQVVRIRGDGRCLFRALIVGQQRSKTESHALASREEACRADALRSKICDELLKSRTELEPFIDGDFEAYVDVMRQTATWGGEPELACAARVLNQPIRVFQRSGASELTLVSQYGEEQAGHIPAVLLLFHRLGHYDLLLPDNPRSKL